MCSKQVLEECPQNKIQLRTVAPLSSGPPLKR